MIACGECVRVTGWGEQGTSWICGDCRVGIKPFKSKAEEERQPLNLSHQNFERNDKILNIPACGSTDTMRLQSH